MARPRFCFFGLNLPITVTVNHFEFVYGAVVYRFLHRQPNQPRGHGRRFTCLPRRKPPIKFIVRDPYCQLFIRGVVLEKNVGNNWERLGEFDVYMEFAGFDALTAAGGFEAGLRAENYHDIT